MLIVLLLILYDAYRDEKNKYVIIKCKS